MPLTSHLAELRARIFRVLLAWVLGTAAAWNWREEIFAALLRPALDALGALGTEGALGEGGALQAIAPTEIFFTYLKCALLAGFVLSLPVFFWQLWAFVAPGLYASEKRVALPFVLVSTLLFAAGGAFGYFIVFPVIFDFLASFESELVQSAWTMREVFALTTRLLLAFGCGFELPVVVFFLAVGGVVSPRRLLSGTRYAIPAAFVLSALLTPPDPLSQVMLAAPLVLLYVAAVGIAMLVVRRRERSAGEEGEASQA